MIVSALIKMCYRFKKIIPIIMAAIISSGLISITALAEDDNEYVNSDTGYEAILHDDADILSPQEENEIMESMEEITKFSNVGFISSDDNFGSTQSLAIEFLDTFFGESSDTVVLAVDMNNRNIYIFTDGRSYSTINEGKCNSITDNVYSYLSDGEYSIGIKMAFSQIYTLLTGGKIAEPMKVICNILISIAVSMLIVYIFIYTTSKSKLATGIELVKYANKQFHYSPPTVVMTNKTKKYSPRSSSSGGHGGHGGHSGGGGGHHF